MDCPKTCNTTQTRPRLLAVATSLVSLFIYTSCSEMVFHPVSETVEQEVKDALRGRSFRQFDPHPDSSTRKGVILDFVDRFGLWAQYGEDRHAVNEWEIIAHDVRVEMSEDGSEVRLYFIDPKTLGIIPSRCEDCIDIDGISISVRDVFDRDKIAFKINDPEKRLPSPFPVFHSWTTFREDEIFH